MEISDFKTIEVENRVRNQFLFKGGAIGEATVYYRLQKVDYKYQMKSYLSWKLPSSEVNIKMTKRKIISFPALK